MSHAQELSYGRVRGSRRRGIKLTAFEKKCGDSVGSCAVCATSIVTLSQQRDLCRSLFGVDELPAVCDTCMELLQEEWLAFMRGQTPFCAGRLTQPLDSDVDAPEMVS